GGNRGKMERTGRPPASGRAAGPRRDHLPCPFGAAGRPVPRVGTVSPNEYPTAELDRAEQALAVILDDQRWPSGDARIPWRLVLRGLRGKGFTLGVIDALVKRLTDEGIFAYHRNVIPAGHRWESGAWVHRSEPEIHESFVTTRQRWREYIARRA